ncbi:hypothetical protein QFZ20_004344 [Flavobacterium sp. W4I14]|nr:hypothetical protein [Flavobacterium sp. W4I14]
MKKLLRSSFVWPFIAKSAIIYDRNIEKIPIMRDDPSLFSDLLLK